MRFLFALGACLTGITVQAGVVRGVVVEHASGYPLARSQVRLIPIPPPGGGVTKPTQVRVNNAGAFLFINVPDGLYLLVANRPGYFPAAYGQRRPEGQGTPIEVTRDSDLFTALRMRRQGAITGRVLDENGIGIEGITVAAYRSRLPLRPSGRAVSDDRGVYRIHGLEPGKYVVRSVEAVLDDGTGRLPTFGPESRELREARVHRVLVDQDTTDADTHPIPGTLFRLSGALQCASAPVIVTLSSEAGRRTTPGRCDPPGNFYVFEGVPPGFYEIFASAPGAAGFIELSLERDIDSAGINLTELPRVEFEVRRPGSTNAVNLPLTVTGKRDDSSGAEPEQEIKMPRTALLPGHWGMSATVGPGQFVESIVNLFGNPRRTMAPLRAPDWFDIFLDARAQARIRITVSDQAAHLVGTVVRDSKGVPGAPVFLWPVTEAARRSLKGLRQVLTGTDGKFNFDGLPPGEYRVLATFDISEVDEEVLDEAHVAPITVDAARIVTLDVPLWIAP